MRNPFPGLRPFEADEEHLFFGRESEIDDLLRTLRTSRFVAVVGTSGSGKSSLVRSGLIPALQGGFMVGAGSSWRIATLRPGEDPIGNLAHALNAPDVLGTDDDLAATNQVLIDATLRRSTLGLVQAVRQARIPPDHNLLVLVDQFEELFRFRRGQREHSRDEAVAFVKLLLEAAAQAQAPIFIVLTMRSDFIGDCMDFRGLPEAVNKGLYLVGRMTRDALRSALTGPVAVAGGAIAPRLVNRVLNDLGDDQDQLPLVQHAMMRTWEFWSAAGKAEPMDVVDYEAVGTVTRALSLHAEEAYLDCEAAGRAHVAERVFKALTDTFSDPRGVRRPTSIADLSAIASVPEADIVAVVELFRRAGRSFLMPPPSGALVPTSIVDLSHESLMRCWDRLISWADEEQAAAGFYARLSQAAGWHAQGAAGLWRDPELQLALQWRRENDPNAAWARRYDAGFARALVFLDDSAREHQRILDEQERERRRSLRRAEYAAAVLATMLIAAVALAVVARRESRRAEANLALARDAVDESLSSADRSAARVGADTPDLEELRRELLDKAQQFYAAFLVQAPRSEQSRRDFAAAQVRLGHIHRLMGRAADAERAYRDAAGRLEQLAAGSATAEHRALLATSYNWLGEVLRPQPARAAEAEQAYDRAFGLQQALVAGDGPPAGYREELARTLYNRGILLSGRSESANRAQADFRQAIALLEPMAAGSPQAAQELARAYNNLGSLLSSDPALGADVRRLWEQAIAIDERLLEANPGHREYQFELATYAGNLAALLNERGERQEADRRSRQALALMEALARAAPSLAVARADAHTLRGAILRSLDTAQAERELGVALDLFASMRQDTALHGTADFHLRLGDLLVHSASLAREARGATGAPALLSRAVSLYLDIAASSVASGHEADARLALDNVNRVLSEVAEPGRAALVARYRQLDQQAGARGTLR